MFRIFLLTSLFFLQVISPIRSNDHFYYSPKGKESLELSHTKILIQFASGLSIERQQEILVAHKLVAPIQSEYLLPAPRVTLAPLVDVHSDEEVWRLLSELRAYPYIEYAYPVFNHSDGTAMGLQSKLLVRLKTDNQYPVLENMALRYGLQIAAQNEFDDLLFHLSIQDATADPLSIAQFLFETKLFEYVEPDFLRFMHRMSTNDPALSRQWSVRNTGQNSGTPGTVGADMQVMDAWRTTTGSASVRIAVLDEGVDLNHPDLVGNLLRGYDATEQNSGGAPSGDDAHGTACAGIVAAVGNNGIGMAGVAYGSKIVPIRIAYSNGESWVTSSAWISNAINWAWREGQADVMSNSWGGGGSSFSINSAINNAIEQGRNGLGTPVVFAAGNENTNVSYPADYSPTIAVGAMSMCYERKSPNSCDNETWWGSNYGTHLDVVAPGTRIYAADISGAAGYSDADYAAYFNGTSSATPNVAGVAALILSANGNLTEQQVRFALESTCRKVGNYTYNQGVTGQPTGSWHPEMGYGLVNAAAAIQAVAPSQADDAGIMEIINPTNAICGTRVQPTVRLRNNGSNTLRRVNIHTRISSEEVQVYEWTGNLASTTTTEVTLPEITAAASTHTLEIYTSLPNAKSDSNPSNDRAFAAFSIGSERFSLNIMLDNYGSETSWEVVDVSENVILQGGPYQDNTMGQEINELFCLPNGCYELVFYDAYDDGMCCGYGEGSYQLVQLSDNQTLATGGQYTDRIAHDFCIDSPIEEEEPSPDPLIVEITSVTNVRCHGDRSGAAAISARGGISPYTYEWSSGHTQASANNLGADTYTITVEDAAGQSSVQTIVISQPSRLQTTATAQTATDNQGGSASVDVTGGTTPYRYRWSNGENTATISNLSSGIYVVTVTDQNNCSQTESVMVNNESTPELSANITIINSLRCNGDSDGTARVQISGGIAPYSFRWSNGGTAVQTNNLSEGAFAVTVSDSRGHSLRTESYMTAPSALSLQTSSQTATDNEGGSANVGVTGGTAPYRYRWSTGGNTAAITNLSSATYTVTVTDQNNCSKVASVVVANEITPDPIDDSGVRFEKGQLLAVDDNWQTVELIHNYQSMIVIATVRLPNTDTNPVVTRIKNATGNRFDIKLQNPSGASVGSLVVDYFVVEEGIYTETEHGIKMEAVKAWSTKTASRNDWILERRTYQNNYQSPVVLGQVMTNNDARWSVFWASSSSRRNAAPEQNKLAIGKHVGEDLNSDRADEQIGYVVFESGIQEINNTKFYTALGADKIRGVSNSTNGYAYNINGLSAANIGVLSAAGMDSNNGGWPVLLGDNAVNADDVRMAFDEDQIRDVERAHTTEQVAFIVFEDTNVNEEEDIATLVMEYGKIRDVNNQWRRITLEHTYQSMVVVATVIMENAERLPVVTRIKDTNGNSFSIKVQNPSGQNGGNYDVQYFVVEEGVYNEFDHGVTMEAVKMTSTKTSARRIWEYEPRTYQNNYTAPVVLGQVMSYNDPRWSMFWANNGNRKKAPTATGLSVGKHVGEDAVVNRANETLGYVVFESGMSEGSNIRFRAGVSDDQIYGIYNTSSGYREEVPGTHSESVAVLSSAAMDGSDCGWPVLYGNAAVDTDRLVLVIDEDDTRDDERAHPSEQVAYIVFDLNDVDGFAANSPDEHTPDSTHTAYATELMPGIITYPNPTVDWVTMASNQILVGKTTVQLFNTTGHLVQQRIITLDPKAKQQLQLDVQDLPSGQYFVRVQNEYQSYVTSFIKQ